MLLKVHITNTVKILIAIVVCGIVIGFAGRKTNGNTCSDIVIRIDNLQENYFVDDNDVLLLMTNGGNEVIIGESFDELNLKEIENRVKKEPFIKNVQIFRDLKGFMLVEVELRRPFARVISNTANNYIAIDGTVLPVSNKYNTRALILTGEYFEKLEIKNLNDTEEGQSIYKMLQFINNNKFWKAQIAQIEIDNNLDMLIQPQITKQMVEFGTPTEFEKKFKKLRIFYKQILPQKGWNAYERVNLKYKDQIIAE